jgi:hypothetical protein
MTLWNAGRRVDQQDVHVVDGRSRSRATAPLIIGQLGEFLDTEDAGRMRIFPGPV